MSSLLRLLTLLFAFSFPLAAHAQKCETTLGRLARYALIESFYQGMQLIRYDIRVHGAENLKAHPAGTLVISNHSAYVEPPLTVGAFLHHGMRLRPVITEAETRGLFGQIAVKVPHAVVMARQSDSAGSRREIAGKARAAFGAINGALAEGDNLLIYAGHLTPPSGVESFTGKKAIPRILKDNPEARVLLVKNVGLFGSSFSHGFTGEEPELIPRFLQGVGAAARNGVFFGPKRAVHFFIEEPTDFPYTASPAEILDYLNRYYPPHPAVRLPRYRGEDIGVPLDTSDVQEEVPIY